MPPPAKPPWRQGGGPVGTTIGRPQRIELIPCQRPSTARPYGAGDTFPAICIPRPACHPERARRASRRISPPAQGIFSVNSRLQFLRTSLILKMEEYPQIGLVNNGRDRLAFPAVCLGAAWSQVAPFCFSARLCFPHSPQGRAMAARRPAPAPDNGPPCKLSSPFTLHSSLFTTKEGPP